MFVNKLFVYLTCEHLKNYYFHLNTKILVDFLICTSVPLKMIKLDQMRNSKRAQKNFSIRSKPVHFQQERQKKIQRAGDTIFASE